ncbi:sensor histidine kinase [Salinigranum sp. GCM10025319]|uniref:sensor histidine kinase n=1 Tax=Salinigranum sp. GCM10025319 TaxID=3252687 RepID=UPI00360A22C1
MVFSGFVAAFDLVGTIGFLVAFGIGLRNYRETDVERPVWLAFTFTAGLGVAWMALTTVEWLGVSSALMDLFNTALQAVVIGLFAVGVVGTFAVIGDLKRSRAELRRERDRLDEFAGHVSHDLRSPLGVATGRLELARHDCDSEHLDAIERSLARMERLITDLLALARQGKAVGEAEPVALDDLVSQCWATVETDGGHIEVVDAPTIRADRSRVETMLENLFRNDVEHGSTGNRTESDDAVGRRSRAHDDGVERDDGVTVTVGTVEGGDGFYVADDGDGIPPDDRPTVFESGYSTNDDGTGFGLAIVKGIVEAHGWEITVTESVDGGARFEITGVETIDSEPSR